MTSMRKFVAALVLGLVMSLALLTTGAFAQSANSWFHHPHFVAVNVSSVAVADNFGGLFGGFDCFGPFFDGAFAHANAHIFGSGWGW